MGIQGVHLVGSVPLHDNHAVFAEAWARLSPHIKRIPDGETGDRTNWIRWQAAVFAATPGLQDDRAAQPQFAIVPGESPRFGNLGYRDAALDSYRVFSQLQTRGAVPESVELGYHLCYGDAGHQHFVEPADSTWLVKVANGIAAGLQRSLDWLHLPVPKSRTDDGYFEPLKGLELAEETELYLSLVHHGDGLAGGIARATTAARHVPGFGVATECGFGRRPAHQVASLMEQHIELIRNFSEKE